MIIRSILIFPYNYLLQYHAPLQMKNIRESRILLPFSAGVFAIIGLTAVLLFSSFSAGEIRAVSSCSRVIDKFSRYNSG
jgi:hypothetical protein